MTVGCLVLSSSSLFAQKPATTDVRQIDSYVKSIDRIVHRRKEPDMVFADTGDYDGDRPDWKRFASIKELDKSRDEKETYSVAYNWREKGKLAAANFTYFSPSGDWSQYVEHYFRPNGSLAFVRAELRTFEGDCAIKQKYYFDRKGRRLKRTVSYFDLNTNKPKKPCVGADALKFDYYTSVGKLPFASLLKEK